MSIDFSTKQLALAIGECTKGLKMLMDEEELKKEDGVRVRDAVMENECFGFRTIRLRHSLSCKRRRRAKGRRAMTKRTKGSC